MKNKLESLLIRRARRLGLEVKTIGDLPHAKAPCFKCGELVWVSVYSLTPSGIAERGCSDCIMLRKKRGVADKAAGTDIRYHGN